MDVLVGLMVGSFGTWSVLALAVAYFHAGVVNLPLMVAKRRRWVR